MSHVNGPSLLAPAFGGVTFSITIVVAVEVHPFTGSVAVTVYIPGSVTIALAVLAANPPGPVHEYVAPAIEVALTVTLVMSQVSGPSLLAVTPGSVTFSITVVVAVDVHPFTGSVTVTVYVPGAVTEALAVLAANPPGPVHEYVAPAIELALTVALVMSQVSGPSFEAVAPGSVIFCATVVVAVEVHPVVVFVTVKV